MAPKAAKGDVLQQKSPAEFFADNRTIAGFDNVRRRGGRTLRPMPPPPRRRMPCARPGRCHCAVRPRVLLLPRQTPAQPPRRLLWVQPGKCLYTTIRELVENALDAAESISQLPDVDITMWARARCSRAGWVALARSHRRRGCSAPAALLAEHPPTARRPLPRPPRARAERRSARRG